MAKVWNKDNRVKYDPADVDRWKILEAGKSDYFNDNERLTQWQVVAFFYKASCINVGYYGSEKEAIDAADELDAISRSRETGKVWDVDNKIKFDPDDVRRWLIYEPGGADHHKKGVALTQWQVCAACNLKNLGNLIYVGYYDSEQEAVEAVDEMDVMKREEPLASVGELIQEGIE